MTDMMTETRSNAVLRCGDCAYHRDNVHPAMGQPCQKLGVAPSKTAPPCWSPNLAALRPMGQDSMRSLAALVASMTPQQSRIIMGLLRNAGSLERVKLTFLQEVFFKLGQGDALDLFYRGYAVARGPDNTVQVLASPVLGGSKALTAAYIARGSVLTRVQFEKARNALTVAGRIYHVPRKPRVQISDAFAYEPPTFDTSPEELEARAKRERGGKKRKQRDDTPMQASQSRRKKGSIFHVDAADVNDGL